MNSNINPEKPHILFLPRWYPNKYDPMPGLFILRHAETLTPNCKISVLYVHPDIHLNSEKINCEYTYENDIYTWRFYLKIIDSRFKFWNKLINTYRYISAHYRGVKKIKKANGKLNLIHVHVLSRLGIMACVYGFIKSIPYVITEHWTRYLPERNEYKGFLRKILTQITVKNAKAVMPVTFNLQKAMEKYGLKNKNYQIVPNVVNTDLFTIKTNNTNSDVTQLVHISCFTDTQKNISGIINVIHKLVKLRQDFNFKFIGEGEDFKRLKLYTEQLKIPRHCISFKGLLEGELLAHELKESAALILFSRHENLPVVILESLSCGVPVISTDVGGIHEHLKPEFGKLIAANDEDALLENILNILDQSEIYDAKKLRNYALNHFSYEVIGKKLYKIYSSILNT